MFVFLREMYRLGIPGFLPISTEKGINANRGFYERMQPKQALLFMDLLLAGEYTAKPVIISSTDDELKMVDNNFIA